jgi:broad specificity phosphatase PhoE
MRIIITRHGETYHNVERIIMGQSLDSDLTENGLEQAKRLGERLRNHEIDIIYSSDLGRAAKTAAEIARHHRLEIHFSRELRERSVGIHEGKKMTEQELNDFLLTMKDPDATFQGGETLKEAVSRAERFIQNIVRDHPNETVLVVTHGAIGDAMVAAITRTSLGKIKDIDDFRNTAVYIFEIDEDRNHKLLVRNCTRHLD